MMPRSRSSAATVSRVPEYAAHTDSPQAWIAASRSTPSGAFITSMADIAPRNVATEAYSLQTAGLTIGIAVGAAVAGAIASARGPHETFLAAALAIAAGAVVYHRAKPQLRTAAADGARAAAAA